MPHILYAHVRAIEENTIFPSADRIPSAQWPSTIKHYQFQWPHIKVMKTDTWWTFVKGARAISKSIDMSIQFEFNPFSQITVKLRMDLFHGYGLPIERKKTTKEKPFLTWSQLCHSNEREKTTTLMRLFESIYNSKKFLSLFQSKHSFFPIALCAPAKAIRTKISITDEKRLQFGSPKRIKNF